MELISLEQSSVIHIRGPRLPRPLKAYDGAHLSRNISNPSVTTSSFSLVRMSMPSGRPPAGEGQTRRNTLQSVRSNELVASRKQISAACGTTCKNVQITAHDCPNCGKHFNIVRHLSLHVQKYPCHDCENHDIDILIMVAQVSHHTKIFPTNGAMS